MYDEVEVSDSQKDYKAQKEAFKKKAQALKNSGKIGKAVATEVTRTTDPASRARCELIRRVFREGMDMYEDGTFTLKEFADDLHKTLLAIEE